MSETLTLKDAAERLGLSVRELLAKIDSREIDAVKEGRDLGILESEIERVSSR